MSFWCAASYNSLMAVEEGATCHESCENFMLNYVVPGGAYSGRQEVISFGCIHGYPASELTSLVTMVPMHDHTRSAT